MEKENIHNLRKNILSGIHKYEYRQARNFLVLSAVTGTMSLAGIVGSVWYLAATLTQTSFYHYLSLVFTDADLVLPYWKEFVLSLAETLPLFGITLILVGVVAFLLSLRTFVGNISHRSALPSFSI